MPEKQGQFIADLIPRRRQLRPRLQKALRRISAKKLLASVLIVCVLAVSWFLYRKIQLSPPTLEVVSAADQLSFYSHWETRLPEFRADFIQAAAEHGLEWPLLSAIGYQESKWRADAVSPTGVRGLMMLTRSTAKELGVEDRTAPEQSIRGGAQYLKYLLARAPKELSEEEKLWFAVSSYNGGFRRVRTAFRQWASIEGIVPSWRAFEQDMLGADDRTALKVSMLYTQRVRDFYKIAGSLVKGGE